VAKTPAVISACDDKSTLIVASVAGPEGAATVTHGGSACTVPQTASASDAGHADKDVVVWSKGKEVTFEGARRHGSGWRRRSIEHCCPCDAWFDLAGAAC